MGSGAPSRTRDEGGDAFAQAGEPGSIHRALERLRAGGRVHVGPGDHLVDAPIVLPSGTSLIGAGTARTRITLAPGSNCHLITNQDHRGGNVDMEVRDLTLVGNMRAQERPDGHSGTTFACGAYFKGAARVRIVAVDATSVRQTAFHFSGCSHVVVEGGAVDEVGWSGVSTSGTDDLVVRALRITRSGLDGRHSAVHLDGGAGAHLDDVVIERSSGNGFMLGSKFSPLRDVVVRGVATGAMRGVAVFGQGSHPVENVLVTGTFTGNRECGVLLFNASNVFLVDSTIDGNGGPAIVLEGKTGVARTVVVGCRITGSPEPIASRDGNRPAYVTGTTWTEGAIEAEPLQPAVPATTNGGAPRPRRSRMRSAVGRAVRSRAAKAPPDRADDDAFAGACAVCGTSQTFVRRHAAIREGYRCRSCTASLRYQGQAAVLVHAYAQRGSTCLAELVREPTFASLDVWEPGVLGPFRPHFDKLPGYVTSDYLPEVPRGEVSDGVRCEDLTSLTFAPGSFDLVVTSDIFEHVRQPEQGFREVHRVLRPGGRHVCSIPILEPWRSATLALVDTSGPEDVHLYPPQYHLGPKKSLHLVYNEFGRDLIDLLDGVGFDTEVVGFQSASPEASKLLTLSSVRR